MSKQADMAMPPPQDVSRLLIAWSDGDEEALEQLMPLVYEELHRLAHRHLCRERAGHTLQTTALVQEAYLRLIDQKEVRWQNRAHFFAVAAQMMRRILVDYARSRRFAKRGGGAQHVSLDEALVVSNERAADIVALHEALNALSELDERKSRMVELRFFGGLSIEETAEVLRVISQEFKLGSDSQPKAITWNPSRHRCIALKTQRSAGRE